MAAPETLTFTEKQQSVQNNMIYCVHVCAQALHVHMVLCDMMYSRWHSIPPAIIKLTYSQMSLCRVDCMIYGRRYNGGATVMNSLSVYVWVSAGGRGADTTTLMATITVLLMTMVMMMMKLPFSLADAECREEEEETTRRRRKSFEEMEEEETERGGRKESNYRRLLKQTLMF